MQLQYDADTIIRETIHRLIETVTRSLDALYHGGILSVFMTNWFTAHLMHHKLGRASQGTADAWKVNVLDFWLSNSLDSGAFHGAQAQWERIAVPFYSVGNWTGFGLHLRGNTEAFMRSP